MRLFDIVVIACMGTCFVSAKQLVDSDQKAALEALSVNPEYMRTFPFEAYQICSVPHQGTFYIDTRNDVIKACLSVGRPWEPQTDQVISRYTKPDSIALDIGAHIGTHTLALSKAVGPNGLVIAFEPQKKIYRELCMNLRLNSCGNVIPVRCALGNGHGEVGMEMPLQYNEGGTYVGSGPDRVSLTRLDDFHLHNISFIKMDVENYEDFVLAGGADTIAQSKPVIFLEIQGNCEQLATSGGTREEKTKATIAQLSNMGYQVSLFSGCDYLALPTI